MKKRIGHRQLGKLLAATAAVVGFAGIHVSRSDAALIVDVEAVMYNGGALPAGSNAKFVTNTAAGGIVRLNIYGTVDDGTVGSGDNDFDNGFDDDAIQSIQGSMLSSTGGLLGTLNTAVRTSPFNQTGSGVGSSNDYDLDGDLDLGGPPSTNIIPLGVQWQLRSAAPTWVGVTGKIQMGRANFVIGSNGGLTEVNWSRRTDATGGNFITAALWFENGIAMGSTVATYGSGAPVVIQIPEPSSLAVVGVAGIGLLARRRNE